MKMHYVWNENFGPANGPSVSEASVESQAAVIMLWDGMGGDRDLSSAGSFRKRVGHGFVDPPTGLHFEGENYAFADGHVKYLNRKSVPDTDVRFTLTATG
jgi:hypothetical protein